MNLLKKAYNRYKKLGIQFVISFTFNIVAVMGIIFIGMSLSYRFSESTKSIISQDSLRIIDQVNLNIDTYLRNMVRVSNSMHYLVIKNTDLGHDSLDEEIDLLQKTNQEVIVSVALFDEKGGLIAASPLNQLKSFATPTEQKWFVSALNKIENYHFSSPYVQNLFSDPDYYYKWVITLSRAVELTTYGVTHTGVLLVDMNFSGIEQIFKDVNLGKKGYIYLIDNEGEVIYHPKQQLLYAHLYNENNKNVVNYEDGVHDEKFDGENRIFAVKTVGYTGWKIVGVIPASDITEYSSQTRTFILFIILFTIFLMIFVNMVVSSIIANPIRALDMSVKKLESGMSEVDFDVGGSYEIEHLSNSIRKMVVQMRSLMDDIVTEQEAKRKSELNALQAQINPHFLYNTLDSIVWMIENERHQEAISMVTSLARLFRISLSKGKNIITLREELEHAKHYLTIQKMRYKNKFAAEITVDENTLEFATIKLIIQPILENAIYHGVQFMSGDGIIAIKIYTEGKNLHIDVSDNGLGMEAKEAERLLTTGETISKIGSGIGLKNVVDRIQLYFGKEYGIKIFSEPDIGTMVRIILPQKPYEKEDEDANK